MIAQLGSVAGFEHCVSDTLSATPIAVEGMLLGWLLLVGKVEKKLG